MPHRKRKPGSGSDAWSKHIHDLIDEMSNRMFFEFRSTRTWQPRVNIYSSDRTIILCVELAGLDPSGVTLEGVSPVRIRLCGSRARPTLADGESPTSIEMMEIDEGPFQRDFDLPEAVDVDHVSVSYERGILWVILPKTEAT